LEPAPPETGQGAMQELYQKTDTFPASRCSESDKIPMSITYKTKHPQRKDATDVSVSV
jgi:hypothetical protein